EYLTVTAAGAAGASAGSRSIPAEDAGITYVLNTRSMKFHYPNCSSVQKMKAKNRQDTTDSREEVMARGYSPCGNCKP
ncbi:MAG: hypothetical protein J5947_04115, partial [Clostridium sp.]|nr:hypothetical protein [Clostridium sp.]